MDFTIPVDHRVKIKGRKKTKQIPGSFHRAENTVEHEIDSDTIVVGALGMAPKRLKTLGELEIRERMKTTALLRSFRILRRGLDI